jgi:hypothetical protein
LGIGCGIVKIAADVAEPRRKGSPVGVLGRAAAGESLDPFPQVAAQPVITEFLLIQADHGKRFGQLLVQVKVEQGRDEFAPGQIAGGAKDHEDRGFQESIGLHPYHAAARAS